MIRLATSADLQIINDIYNQAVAEGFRTAHAKPVSLDERKAWFSDHSSDTFPVYVFTENSNVLGWISVSAYRSGRQALNEVVEISYYVDYDHHHQGIATKLMEKALEFCRSANYRITVAILISQNIPSISLLEKFGFTQGGRIPDAIHHQEEFRDHLYMYKKL